MPERARASSRRIRSERLPDATTPTATASPTRSTPSEGQGRHDERPAHERLPGEGHRRRRHPRRARQVPDAARGQGRLRGRATAAPTPTTTGTASPTADDACPRRDGRASTDPVAQRLPEHRSRRRHVRQRRRQVPGRRRDFNGVADDDGCPDEGGKPLVDDRRQAHRSVSLTPLKIGGPADAPDVDPASMTDRSRARAGAQSSPRLDARDRCAARSRRRTRRWTRSPGRSRSCACSASFSHRDGVAESIGWDAVKNRPGAESGVGFLDPDVRRPRWLRRRLRLCSSQDAMKARAGARRSSSRRPPPAQRWRRRSLAARRRCLSRRPHLPRRCPRTCARTSARTTRRTSSGRPIPTSGSAASSAPRRSARRRRSRCSSRPRSRALRSDRTRARSSSSHAGSRASPTRSARAVRSCSS